MGSRHFADRLLGEDRQNPRAGPHQRRRLDQAVAEILIVPQGHDAIRPGHAGLRRGGLPRGPGQLLPAGFGEGDAFENVSRHIEFLGRRVKQGRVIGGRHLGGELGNRRLALQVLLGLYWIGTAGCSKQRQRENQRDTYTSHHL